MRPDLIKEFLQDDGVESGAVICLEEACKGVGDSRGWKRKGRARKTSLSADRLEQVNCWSIKDV